MPQSAEDGVMVAAMGCLLTIFGSRGGLFGLGHVQFHLQGCEKHLEMCSLLW